MTLQLARTLLALTITFVAASASAQSISKRTGTTTDSFNARAGLLWNAPRDADFETQGLYGPETESVAVTEGLGLAAEFSLPIDGTFSVGCGLRLQAWNAEEFESFGVDSSTLVDLNIVGKLLAPIGSRDTFFYLGIPVGLSVFIPSAELESGGMSSGGGLNAGIQLGVEQIVAYGVGVYADLGLIGRLFAVDVLGTDVMISEYAIHANVGVSVRF